MRKLQLPTCTYAVVPACAASLRPAAPTTGATVGPSCSRTLGGRCRRGSAANPHRSLLAPARLPTSPFSRDGGGKGRNPLSLWKLRWAKSGGRAMPCVARGGKSPHGDIIDGAGGPPSHVGAGAVELIGMKPRQLRVNCCVGNPAAHEVSLSGHWGADASPGQPSSCERLTLHTDSDVGSGLG